MNNVIVVATPTSVILWLLLCVVGLGVCISKGQLRPLLAGVDACFFLAGVGALLGWFVTPFWLMALGYILYIVDAVQQPRRE